MRWHGLDTAGLRVARNAVCKSINGSKAENLRLDILLELRVTEDSDAAGMEPERRCSLPD
jgi:hypothetical protein